MPKITLYNVIILHNVMVRKVAILGKQNPIALREKSRDYILENGFCADILNMETRNLNDFKEQLTDYEVIISCGEKIPKEAISYLATEGKLKLLSRCGVGTDEMDHAEATAQGIAICNAAGSLSTAVAECAMGLIINVLRDFVNADADVRRGDWSRFFESKTSRQLEGKTVGLIGFGDIARALAKMLRGFDCRVLAFDVSFNKDLADELGVEEADITTIQRESDVISLHASAVKETIGMINAEFLQGMKDSAILINTGRGKLVNEANLIEALQSGVIAGAGLDVFEKEPLDIDNPLLKLKNVVLLPHYASGTEEALARVNAISAKNAVDFLQGKTISTILNPDYIKNIRN